MSEWKATGYVFLVLGIIATGIYLYINRQQQINYTYKGCRFSYIYKVRVDTSRDEYYAAKRSYGKCLCEQYLKQPNPALADSIVNTGLRFGYMLPTDTVTKLPYKSIDTLIKHRDWIFNPAIMMD